MNGAAFETGLKVLSSSGKGDTKLVSVYNVTAQNFRVMALRDTKLRSSLSKNIHLSRDS